MERAIIEEMRSRFVVAGVEANLAWQEEEAVRYVAQSLLEQGAAYTVSGRHLVLASSKEMVRDILQAAASPAAARRIDGAVEFYALVRIGDAKPVFDSLMNKLDGKTGRVPAKKEQEEESNADLKFFSDNLSSLIAATTFRDMRVRRNRGDGMMVERVAYTW
jgi:hypothetical protein